MALDPAKSQRPNVFAAPTSAPFGHGDKVGGGPNGLDGLPGRLVDPPQGPSCMTQGASPGPSGASLLNSSKMGDFAALHGRAKP
jgi:hypothetical protein